MIRTVWLVFALAAIAPSSAVGQSVSTDPVADALRRTTQSSARLRVGLVDGRTHRGAFLGVFDGRAVYRPRGGSADLQLHAPEVSFVDVRVPDPGGGALVYGAVGATVGGLLGFATTGWCQSPGCISPAEGLLVGALVTGAVGATIGAVIGGLTGRWERVYPAPTSGG